METWRGGGGTPRKMTRPWRVRAGPGASAAATQESLQTVPRSLVLGEQVPLYPDRNLRQSAVAWCWSPLFSGTLASRAFNEGDSDVAKGQGGTWPPIPGLQPSSSQRLGNT